MILLETYSDRIAMVDEDYMWSVVALAVISVDTMVVLISANYSYYFKS